MKQRIAIWLSGTAMAGVLYFFENNAGTRIALACMLLLPLLPVTRRALFGADGTGAAPRAGSRTGRDFGFREADEPGEVRAYLPGDPLNRIHWKLSAKRDELLVRERAVETVPEETQRRGENPLKAAQPRSRAKPAALVCLAVALAAAALLLAVPAVARGAQALLNRLFDASEARNAYAYVRFPVPDGQPVTLAAALLAVLTAALTAAAALSGSRWTALAPAAGCVGFQVYFGLSFPVWINVALTALFALAVMRRPLARRHVLPVLAGVAALTAAVLLVWPGVDAATEAASERIRDRLTPMAQIAAGTEAESDAAGHETRHVHTRSLREGEGEGHPEDSFRLENVEEQQIAMPHWVDYLRIALLLLAMVAVLVVPFLPFALLNARRRKTLATREAFRSGPVPEAVCAIFRQVIAWLEATGNGAENRLYSRWTPVVSERISADYGTRFGACALLFEEAAYSDHALGEEQRQQVLDLLRETEETLLARSDRWQRLRLKYKECLWL